MDEELESDTLDSVDSLLGIEPDEITESEPTESPAEDEPEATQSETETEKEPEPEEAEDQAEQINYDMAVPMPDGREATTLGALKDRVIELERTEEQIIDRENDLMVRAQELEQALQLAGGEVPPQLKERMATRQTAHLQRENDAMMEAIPAWKDPAVFDADRKALVKVGTSYGLSHKEISGIMDHRIIKFMHDHARLLSAQQTGKDNLKRLSAVPAKKGRKVASQSKNTKLNKQVTDAASSSNADTKHAAVAALLGS